MGTAVLEPGQHIPAARRTRGKERSNELLEIQKLLWRRQAVGIPSGTDLSHVLPVFHVSIPLRLGFNGSTCRDILINIAPRRALAFAYDVELRLNPWYGRARASLTDGSSLAAASPTARMGATWRDGSRDPNGGVGGGGGNNGGLTVTKTREADLLACG